MAEPKQERPICIRCKVVTSQLTSRAEDMCIDCFNKFLRYKLRKQMGDFKVNYAPGAVDQHILLPLSFGKSSLALLDMMCDLIRLQRERNNGKQGFYLHVLHISEEIEDSQARLDQLADKYPECIFEKVLKPNSIPLGNIVVVDEKKSEMISGVGEITSCLRSRSSQQDFLKLTIRQIVDLVALQKGYQTVTYGFCMTALAELVISLTAKGRGAVISDYICPPETRNPRIVYPLGDILDTELDLYLELQKIKHFAIIKAEPPATKKLQSIDELVSQYFTDVDKDFPGVIPTVVRTAYKVEAKNQEFESLCKLCQDPIQKGSARWLEGITVNSQQVIPEDLCYGCTVMIQNSDIGSLDAPRYEKSDILSDYLL